jgi:hypothetical protein
VKSSTTFSKKITLKTKEGRPYNNVVFLLWSVTTMWSSFFDLWQQCGLPSFICYNNVVFLLWSVTTMWFSFFDLLQQCGLPSLICYNNVVFLLWSVTPMWSSFLLVEQIKEGRPHCCNRSKKEDHIVVTDQRRKTTLV